MVQKTWIQSSVSDWWFSNSEMFPEPSILLHQWFLHRVTFTFVFMLPSPTSFLRCDENNLRDKLLVTVQPSGL